MSSKILITLPALALATLLLTPVPADAAGFALFGSWWDTDDLADTLGAGIAVTFPLSDRFDLDLRATYLEDLKDQGFNDLLDDLVDLEDDQGIFLEESIGIIPVEVGVRFDLIANDARDFYIGGGLGYYLLSTDFGSIDDEFGYYAVVGASFGDDVGPALFVEGTWRKIEGTITDLDDLDNTEVIPDVAFDLDGLGINAGIAWRW